MDGWWTWHFGSSPPAILLFWRWPRWTGLTCSGRRLSFWGLTQASGWPPWHAPRGLWSPERPQLGVSCTTTRPRHRLDSCHRRAAVHSLRGVDRLFLWRLPASTEGSTSFVLTVWPRARCTPRWSRWATPASWRSLAEGPFAQPPFGPQRKKSRVEQMGRSTPTSSWPLLKPGGDAAWRTWASKPLGASIIPNPALDGACRPKSNEGSHSVDQCAPCKCPRGWAAWSDGCSGTPVVEREWLRFLCIVLGSSYTEPVQADQDLKMRVDLRGPHHNRKLRLKVPRGRNVRPRTTVRGKRRKPRTRDKRLRAKCSHGWRESYRGALSTAWR